MQSLFYCIKEFVIVPTGRSRPLRNIGTMAGWVQVVWRHGLLGALDPFLLSIALLLGGWRSLSSSNVLVHFSEAGRGHASLLEIWKLRCKTRRIQGMVIRSQGGEAREERSRRRVERKEAGQQKGDLDESWGQRPLITFSNTYWGAYVIERTSKGHNL